MRQYNIPILFIFFNREDIALKTFERIRSARPSRLYLSQDGPRQERGNEEKERVRRIREKIISLIDWECDIHKRFMDKNLGCAMGVKTAIDWMFETESCGIILEDDCVVSDSFFPYMEHVLQRYKDDQRIGMVAGTNPIEKYKGRTSYHFSRFKSCWGWATWSRAWKNMDMDMTWREADKLSVMNNSGFNGRHNSKWRFQLRCIDRHRVSAWDWQWYFSLAAQNQLCVYPAVNLVSNIGNDIEATHTSFGDITRERHELPLPLTAPSIVAPDYHFDKMFDANENRLPTMLARIIPHTLKGYIKRLINR